MTYKIFATDFFGKKFHSLCRKYRRLPEDYKDLLEILEKDPQSGKKLQGCRGPVFKIRMASRDMQRGKSGGFRIIYSIREKELSVYLLTIYSKTEREDIDVREINKILIDTGFI